MNTKIYVGNLSFDATEMDIRDLFSQHGQVNEIFLPTDRDTGRPRGFALVSMHTVEDKAPAIRERDGKDFLGRRLTVNEARPREERPAFACNGSRCDRGARKRY